MSEQQIRLGKFTGLDTRSLPVDVGFEGLVEAVNMDGDGRGHYATRQGRIIIFTGPVDAAYSDGTAFLFLSGGMLRRVGRGGAVDALGPLPGRRLVFATVAGKTLIHTDQAQAVLHGEAFRGFGVPPPSGLEVIVGHGRLEAGRYLVTATELAEDGRESQALPLRALDVADGSALNIIPTVTPGRIARVYVSGKNGREVYAYADGLWVNLAGPSDHLAMNAPCMRQHLGPFPTADLMAWHGSHLWVAAGNRLYRSPPFDYEVCDLRETIPLPGPITMLRSVDNGLFVSDTERLYWMPAGDPAQMTVVWTHSEPAIAGSDRSIVMGRVGQGSPGKGCLFATTSGLCLGAQDGTVTLITHRKIVFPPASKAAATQYNDRFVISVRR